MANYRLRGLHLIWWRRCSKKECAIAVAGFAILIFIYSFISNSSSPLTESFDSSVPDWVPFTSLRNAHNRGAFCLDGSLPGYHLQKGFGSGSGSWVLHIEGGGWCNTIESCSIRKKTPLGSSNYMAHNQFSGILSRHPSRNPDFFNWNKVKVRYCDGASFSGHPETEFKNGTKLFFRGQLIWEALMDELLSIGLSKSRKVLLSGCSAGGLATLIHCDDFRKLLPKEANVKCLADAGFFLNEKDVSGNDTIQSFYRDVENLQGIAKSLKKECLAKFEPSKQHQCFFPQEFIKYIKTPVFLVNPAYDFWQIKNILVPASSDTLSRWSKCKQNIQKCNPSQIEVLHGFRNSLLEALSEFRQTERGGMFINSCYAHCQTSMAVTWHSDFSPRINNRTIAESVGDWYFDRKVVKQIDCAFPCNPSCYNMDFT